MAETIAIALALVCVIEGLVYILFPKQIKKLMAQLQTLRTQHLRTGGLILTVFGLLWLWFILKF